MLHTKYQPNIPCHSIEKVDFIGCSIFSIGSQHNILGEQSFNMVSGG